MAIHGLYFPDLQPVPGGVVTIGGEEAHHALRVKRLSPGDTVRLCNGRGLLGEARLVDSRKLHDGWQIDLDVMSVRQAPPPRPGLTVLASAPKGERLETMIDGLSQVGAVVWAPLHAERTVVEPRPGKLERLERIALEAMKQCGRAWVLEIGAAVSLEAATARAGRVLLADASGGSYVGKGDEQVSLLVGPEGGWSEPELEFAKAKGVELVRLGVHIMRTETAAVVGAGLIMAGEPVAP